MWAARFFKTAAWQAGVETGKIDVGGHARRLRARCSVGDAVRIARGEEIFEVEVIALSDKRGSAAVARLLYRESEAAKALRLETLAKLRAARAGYQAPQGKPDKRARRLIRALGDIDAT